MGKTIHLSKIREFLKSTPIFRTRDIELIVKDRNYSNLILHKLAKKKEIKRVVKGWYSLHEDPTVSVFCFRPAYIGLQEALSIHEIWEQETNTIVVTTRKVRVGIRNVLGSSLVLHRISQKYFFGFDILKYGEFFIPVSDAEKTLIDLVYFNETPGKDVLQEMKKRVDKRKLKAYLARYPPKFRKKVQGIIS